MAKRGKLDDGSSPDNGDLGEPETINPADAAGTGGDAGGDAGNDARRDGGDDFTFDPERHIDPTKRNADGSYRRKRGRKPGSRSGRKKAASSNLDLSTTQAVLLSIHAAASTAFRVPEIALDKNEAEMLAKALVELEAQYPTQVDPRVLAWLNLAGVAGMIYGSRVFAYRMRKENEKAEKEQERPSGDVAAMIQRPNASSTKSSLRTSTGAMPSDSVVDYPDAFQPSKN